MAGNFDRKLRLPHIHFRVLLHAANMRHGTNSFTSLPKEGVLRIFFALKNPTASAGFEPVNLGTKGQHVTSRPPKPLLPGFKPIIIQFIYIQYLNIVLGHLLPNPCPFTSYFNFHSHSNINLKHRRKITKEVVTKIERRFLLHKILLSHHLPSFHPI